MKRTKYLALVLVVAIMMMGAGYAYWTETFTIDNTVNTGELNFGFSDAYVNPSHTTLLSKSTAEVDPDDDNKVKVDWSNVSPGAKIQLELSLKNTGTIDAGVTNFKIVGDTGLLDNTIIDFIGIYDGDGKYYRYNSYKPLADLEDEMLRACSNAYGGIFFPLILDVAKPDGKIIFGFRIDQNASEIDVRESAEFTFTITGEALQKNEIIPKIGTNTKI